MVYPILKPNSSWFSPTISTIKRNIVTIINFLDSYTPSGTPTDSWDASEAQDGSIMCYLEGTTLTIAGNGSGKIMANKDSSRLFSYSSEETDNLFSALTTINGLPLLDTSNCETMERLFRSCQKLKTLDISNFNTSKVKSFYMAFAVLDRLKSLSVAHLDISACEDMGYMFYASALPSIDFENWDVSNVKSFDHFLSGSTSVKSFDISKWDVSSCENCNAMFNDVQVTEYDVSNWDVSNVKVFSQMFETNTVCERIIGLENWNTSNGICFEDMFSGCENIKELNLSSFDTRKAHSGTSTSTNGSTSACTKNMLNQMYRLEKITLGENFTFLGDGTSREIGSLPTQSSTYIENADGNWYTIDGTVYASSDIPNLTANTYYASMDVVKWERDSNKYIHLSALRKYHELHDSYITSKLDKITESVEVTIVKDGEETTLNGIRINQYNTKEEYEQAAASGQLNTSEFYTYPDDSLSAEHNTSNTAHQDIRNTITNLQDEVDKKASTSYVDTKIATIPTPDVSGQIEIHNTSTSAHSDIRAALNNKSNSDHKHDNNYDGKGTANTLVTNHNVAIDAHNDIRTLINNITTKLNNFLDVDDTKTDQLSEILTLINNNKGTLESITNGKVNVSDIIDNLTTNIANKPVSAAQAVVLKGLIDALEGELDSHTGDTTKHISSTERTNWNAAKTHADSTHARTDATKVEASSTNGKIKINGTETTVYTHPTGTNPHGTTKSDIGLSNVPNVATNDQTPTYTQASTLANLTSGEKLSVSFGKIMKAIADLISHLADTVKHITSTERTNWGNAYTHSTSTHAPSDAQKNQNAFSNIKVGSTTVVADTTTDTLTLEAGSNITITPDATNDKITIAATDTTYSVATSSKAGLVKSGTDITVDSSGNVSVNDNSHAHTIANVTDLQSSLDAKQATITGGATTITSSNLTASRALVSDGSGKVAVSAVTSTELEYLDGVTSNIQTQLNNKAGQSDLDTLEETVNSISQSFTTAADAIGDALVAKGVSVPEGTSLTNMATLIGSNLVNSSQANTIKNALTAKGISVPTNASLSDMATLITNNLAKALVSESKWVSIWAGGNRTYTGTVVFSQSFAKTPTVSFTWDAAKWSSVTASNISTTGFTYSAVCNFWDGETAGFTWYARN